MTEDQINTETNAAVQAAPQESDTLITNMAPVLPRAPRTNGASRSFRPETAWVWQRARLICAVKDQTA